MFEVFTCAIK